MTIGSCRTAVARQRLGLLDCVRALVLALVAVLAIQVSGAAASAYTYDTPSELAV